MYDNRPNEASLRYVERKLAKISSAKNEEHARRFILSKTSSGSKPKTLETAATALWHLDRILRGADFLAQGPDDLRQALVLFASDHSASTTATWCAYVTMFYSWAHDGDAPRKLKLALRFRAAKEAPSVQPLTDEDFRALLQAAHEHPIQREAVRHKAFLWLLWDTGFRLSELICVRIGDITFTSEDTARIALPRGAPRLKTGPRTIFITESVPALRTWLAFHPRKEEPEAALFTGIRAPTLHLKIAQDLLSRIGKNAGFERSIHAHLFRHTRATRAARLGWKEAQLRAFFGWGPTSPMPAHYVHLAESDMEQRVRADAKSDPLGAMVKEDPNAALGNIIAATLTALDKAGKLRSGSS